MIPLYEVPSVVRLMETESRGGLPAVWWEANEDLVFDGDRVSVCKGEKALVGMVAQQGECT